MIKHATTDQFVNEVLRADRPVLADFYASWCPPCRMLTPVLDRLAEEFAGQVDIVKVNIDEERSLADYYRISAVPTLILFRDGRPVGTATSLSMTMCVRGAPLPCQGVAWVGAIRTERRKSAQKGSGVASAAMWETLRIARLQLVDARESTPFPPTTEHREPPLARRRSTVHSSPGTWT